MGFLQVRFASKDTGELFPVTKTWWVTNWWLEFDALVSRAGMYEFEVCELDYRGLHFKIKPYVQDLHKPYICSPLHTRFGTLRCQPNLHALTLLLSGVLRALR
jgi:hypothetical protein